MKPHGNYIAVKPKPTESKVGSLIIPESAKKSIIRTGEGAIIEIGDGGDFEVSIGDTVVYEKASEVEMADGLVLIPHKAILYVR